MTEYVWDYSDDPDEEVAELDSNLEKSGAKSFHLKRIRKAIFRLRSGDAASASEGGGPDDGARADDDVDHKSK